MTPTEALEKLIKSFEIYYDVTWEPADPMFAAEAAFHVNQDQYFLIKSANISSSESNEYVFFATCDELTEEALKAYDEAAWRIGTERVKPHNNHRNTDVALIILAGKITEGAAGALRRTHHYKSYKLGFQGWTNYRLAATDLSSGSFFSNRLGKSFKKIFGNL